MFHLSEVETTDELVGAVCILQVLQRVRRKAEMYGQDLDDVSFSVDGQMGFENRPSQYKVDPKLIADLYERWVMPLTKEVQIAYLLRRLNT